MLAAHYLLAHEWFIFWNTATLFSHNDKIITYLIQLFITALISQVADYVDIAITIIKQNSQKTTPVCLPAFQKTIKHSQNEGSQKTPQPFQHLA